MHDLAVHLSGYMKDVVFYTYISFFSEIEVASVVFGWTGCCVKITSKSSDCLSYDKLFGLRIGLADEIVLGIGSEDAVDNLLDIPFGCIIYSVR